MIAEAGGCPALHPFQAEPILGAPVRGSQLLELGQEIDRFPEPAEGRGEGVRQVVVDAEQEAGLALGIDEAVRFLQGLDGGLRVALLDEQEGFLDEAPAGEMRIRVLAVEEALRGKL